MDLITLRTGATVPEPIYKTTMVNLERLWGDNPIAFIELVSPARDANHQPFDNVTEVLTERSFMANGRLHDSVRDVVLAATEGDDFDMRMVSPLSEPSDV